MLTEINYFGSSSITPEFPGAVDAPPGRGVDNEQPFKSERGVLDEVDITGIGQRLLIPRIHIWGSQIKEDYNKDTMDYVCSVMKDNPMGFLLATNDGALDVLRSLQPKK